MDILNSTNSLNCVNKTVVSNLSLRFYLGEESLAISSIIALFFTASCLTSALVDAVVAAVQVEIAPVIELVAHALFLCVVVLLVLLQDLVLLSLEEIQSGYHFRTFSTFYLFFSAPSSSCFLFKVSPSFSHAFFLTSSPLALSISIFFLFVALHDASCASASRHFLHYFFHCNIQFGIFNCNSTELYFFLAFRFKLFKKEIKMLAC